MTVHTMVDVEALGRQPGCVVLSIAAVRFDPEGEGVWDAFERNIIIDSCLEAGLEIDGATVRWWLERSAEARAALFTPAPVPLAQALDDFARYLTNCSPAPIWSHGATYDLPILAKAYDRLRRPIPWPFRLARDTRTLYALVKGGGPIGNGEAHVALTDATAQAVGVQAVYARLYQGEMSGSGREQETNTTPPATPGAGE